MESYHRQVTSTSGDVHNILSWGAAAQHRQTLHSLTWLNPRGAYIFSGSPTCSGGSTSLCARVSAFLESLGSTPATPSRRATVSEGWAPTESQYLQPMWQTKLRKSFMKIENLATLQQINTRAVGESVSDSTPASEVQMLAEGFQEMVSAC